MANPGELKRLKVVITNTDGSRKQNISLLISNMSIFEDIFKNTLYGAVDIIDSVDLLNGLSSKDPLGKFGFQLLGEEFLEIDYEVEGRPPVSLRFAVYKISGIVNHDNNTKRTYTLHFCSEEHLIDATNVVMKSYSQPNSENLKSLANEFLFLDKVDTPFKGKRKKDLMVQDTRGPQRVVIPRLPPLQACQFLARRSIAKDGEKSATYLFFENMNGFNFCDIEYLIKTGMQKAKANEFKGTKTDDSDYRYFFEKPTNNSDPNSYKREFKTILKMEHKSYFDTIEKLKYGMFESDMIVYDFINHTTIPTRFRFLDSTDKTNNSTLTLGNAKGESVPENSITFMKSVTSTDDKDIKYSRMFFIPKDTSQTEQNTYLDEIYPARTSYFTRLAQNMYTIDTFGDPLIRAGDVIYMNIPQGGFDASKNDEYQTGYFLVCTIHHIFTQNSYQTTLDVYKNAFGKKVETTQEAQETPVTTMYANRLSQQFDAHTQDATAPDAEPDREQNVIDFFKRFV
jgi:hypothetical protein